MGEYKVPQNVEAEDKILGPLSLKQFIYAMIGVGWALLTFAILKSVIVVWIIIGVPPALLLLGLGLYQREDQPMETYFIAVLHFFLTPRVYLWAKEPITDAFKLEPPPPKLEIAHRDASQVRSQLQQLTGLMDSHGWTTTRPELQEPLTDTPVIDLQGRIGADFLARQPNSSPTPEVTQADDIFDANSQTAANVNLLIQNRQQSLTEAAKQKMRSPGQAPSITGSTAAPSGDILKLATEGGQLTVAQIATQAQKISQPLAEGQTVNIHDGNTA